MTTPVRKPSELKGTTIQLSGSTTLVHTGMADRDGKHVYIKVVRQEHGSSYKLICSVEHLSEQDITSF